jgi:hypothetical protein
MTSNRGAKTKITGDVALQSARSLEFAGGVRARLIRRFHGDERSALGGETHLRLMKKISVAAENALEFGC